MGVAVKWIVTCATCVLLQLGGMGSSEAREVPRWEAGLGLGVLQAPDYRGSNEQTTYVLPVPYVYYRGDALRIDREGIRGRLTKTRRLGVYLSLAASIPVNSSHNAARKGMPALDAAVEIGPSLFVPLSADPRGRRSWSVGLPLRAVVAGDLHHAEAIGWTFAPHVDLHIRAADRRWETTFSAGPIFASQRYHAYYYQVDPAYATPERPAYSAQAGYSGSRVSVTLSRRNGDLWMGLFARYDDLHGATFVDSPLVKRRSALMLGAGMAYVFAQSSEMVEE